MIKVCKVILFLFKLIAIALMVAGLSFSAYFLSNLFISASGNVKLGILTALISIIVLIYNNSRQQVRDISSRHFNEKREAYRDFIDLIFEFMRAVHTSETPNASLERISKIQKNILVWGSAETMNAYNAFMVVSAADKDGNAEQASEDKPDLRIFHAMETLLRSVRKDLGHSDRKLRRFAVTKLFIVADEHHKFS